MDQIVCKSLKLMNDSDNAVGMMANTEAISLDKNHNLSKVMMVRDKNGHIYYVVKNDFKCQI